MFFKNEMPDNNIVSGPINLIFRARILWRDMATWFTFYLLGLYRNYPSQQSISNRLYGLPLEYGNVLTLIFGDRVSEAYITLLSNYVLILQYLFYSQMIGDVASANNYTQQLYRNIDQRAAHLARINPHWQESVWRSLLIAFNSMFIELSTELLAQEHEKSIDVFNRLLNHSTVIGDYFSEGILNYLKTAPPTAQHC